MKFNDLKVLLWIGGIVIIFSLIPAGILFYQNHELKKALEITSGERDLQYKKLSDSVQRAETSNAKNGEDLISLARKTSIDIDSISKDQQNLGAKIEALAITEAKTTTIVHNNYTSTSSTPSGKEPEVCKEDGRPIDVYGYTKRVEKINLDDSNGMRLADISFSAGEKNPWASKVYGIHYRVLNVMGRTQSGQITLHTELQSENSEAQPGQIFHIEGVSSQLTQTEIPARFSWWNPRLFLLIQLGLEAYPTLDFSASLSLGLTIWAYGDNWRFLGVSAGYDAFQNSFRASFIPAMYNIGEPLPLLTNLWLGLDVSIDTRLNVGVGFVIGTTL